jgi:hypothetical protein
MRNKERSVFMSSMGGINYLSNLLSEANKLRTEQENRQRSIVSQYETKVRQSNISNRERQASANTSANRTITQRKNTLMEPDTTYTKESVRGMTELYNKAKSYNPFSSIKTEKQLSEPLNYFSTVSKDVSTSYLDQTKPLVEQREALLKQKAEALKPLQQQSIIGGNRNTRRQAQAQTQRSAWQIEMAFKSQLEPIEQQLSRLNSINSSVYTNQQTSLKNLIAEQEKYYGKNFENISKEQLALADWKGWQSLSGDLAKYTSLRDQYVNRYKTSGSKIDMDWIKQYNDLIISTQKSMSEELPKVLNAAAKNVGVVKKTQQETMAALEKLNQVFGERGTKQEQTVEQREAAVKDVTNVTRDQAVARLGRINKAGATATKPSPKFEARPS